MPVRKSMMRLSDPERQAIGELNPAGLVPLGSRVLVEVLEENWERPSGLLIPENVRPKSCQGTIVELGLDCPIFDVNDPAPGDHVVFTPVQEETFWWEGREYIVMPFDRILGRVEVRE